MAIRGFKRRYGLHPTTWALVHVYCVHSYPLAEITGKTKNE